MDDTLKRRIAEEYIFRCRIIGANGYTKLSFQRQQIKEDLLNFFGDHGNGEKELISLYDEAIFDFLDYELRGARSFIWPQYHEKGLRKRLTDVAANC